MLLMKTALYLHHKKIPIHHYGTHLLQHSQLTHCLADLSMEELGPINCSITTLYCLYNPSLAVRQQVVGHLGEQLRQVDLHFEVVDCPSLTEIDIPAIKDHIGQKAVHKLNHYFIDSIARVSQLKCLVR